MSNKSVLNEIKAKAFGFAVSMRSAWAVGTIALCFIGIAILFLSKSFSKPDVVSAEAWEILVWVVMSLGLLSLFMSVILAAVGTIKRLAK